MTGQSETRTLLPSCRRPVRNRGKRPVFLWAAYRMSGARRISFLPLRQTPLSQTRSAAAATKGTQFTLQSDRELSNPALDLLSIHRGKSQLWSFARHSAVAVTAQRSHLHIPLGCGSRSQFAVDPTAQPTRSLLSGLHA